MKATVTSTLTELTVTSTILLTVVNRIVEYSKGHLTNINLSSVLIAGTELKDTYFVCFKNGCSLRWS